MHQSRGKGPTLISTAQISLSRRACTGTAVMPAVAVPGRAAHSSRWRRARGRARARPTTGPGPRPGPNEWATAHRPTGSARFAARRAGLGPGRGNGGRGGDTCRIYKKMLKDNYLMKFKFLEKKNCIIWSGGCEFKSHENPSSI